ncbi:MAG: NADH-quinone oxidoreductase subunit C [Bacteroidales bacterium]|nr:NADH-quinone oxidoreductase subunit C [Bacteroidales bacterium]NPV36922.1 NADH-quinone oxidoreductase subunit C [Bacteroidales bacterium]
MIFKMETLISDINGKIIQNWPEIRLDQGQYPTLHVQARYLLPVMQVLKDDPDFYMDYLVLITGVDYKSSLGCTYLLNSSVGNHLLVVKVTDIDRNDPVVDSVTHLWPTANFHEREIYDLLGIRFEGHPDLRRIFLDDNWVGHPLRKDYNDEVNVIERKL